MVQYVAAGQNHRVLGRSCHQLGLEIFALLQLELADAAFVITCFLLPKEEFKRGEVRVMADLEQIAITLLLFEQVQFEECVD